MNLIVGNAYARDSALQPHFLDPTTNCHRHISLAPANTSLALGCELHSSERADARIDLNVTGFRILRLGSAELSGH